MLQTPLVNRGKIDGAMYIDAVKAERFKCFESLEVSSLVHPGDGADLRIPNVNVILGDNGVGKSAVMEAVSLAVLGEMLGSSGYRSEGNVQRVAGGPSGSGDGHGNGSGQGAQSGRYATVRANVTADHIEPASLSLTGVVEEVGDGEQVVIPVRAAGGAVQKILFTDQDPRLFMCAYGTQRQTARAGTFDPSTRNQQYAERLQRVGSLMLPVFSLVPLASWLPGHAMADEVRAILGSLSDSVEFLAEVEKDELLVRYKGVVLPWSGLSDGYRSFFGWVSDLVFRLSRVAGIRPLTEIAGVVLVDEIDLHLHPKWQSEVVQALSRTFPKLQFVLTTHSPLVVGALDMENIVILEQDDKGVSVARRPRSSPWGLSAEQLLLDSEFGFDLDSARERSFGRELDARRRAAAAGDIDAAIELQRMLALGDEGRSPR